MGNKRGFRRRVPRGGRDEQPVWPPEGGRPFGHGYWEPPSRIDQDRARQILSVRLPVVPAHRVRSVLLAAVAVLSFGKAILLGFTDFASPRTPSLELGYLFASPNAPSQEVPILLLLVTGLAASVALVRRSRLVASVAASLTAVSGAWILAFGFQGNPAAWRSGGHFPVLVEYGSPLGASSMLLALGILATLVASRHEPSS